MENKRIAHFIETGIPGGAETLMLDICRYSQDAGHRPLVLHNGHAFFVEQCKRLGIEQQVPPCFHYFKSIKTLPLFILTFTQFLKQHNIDVLHSHLFGPVTAAAMSARLASIPHIGTLHDVYMIEDKPSRIRLLQAAALLGTRLVTVSQTMEEFYRQRATFKTFSLTTIYNGVTQKIDLDKSQARHTTRIKIYSVGRLVALKRHDVLLDAVKQIKTDVDWQLIIVGDGPERHAIEQTIQQYGLTDKVTLLGQRDDVTQLLLDASIFVQCSDTEGLSMSIMEAMAAGLPCIVTDVGGNHELVENQRNGLLVSAGDSQSLADAISLLLQSSTLREKMRSESLRSIAEKFTLDTTCQHYLEQYNALTG